MRLISDDILIDSGQENPFFDLVYPMLGVFSFRILLWTEGHPSVCIERCRKKLRYVVFTHKNRGKVGILVRY